MSYELTQTEKNRYERQMILPEIGAEGQMKLKKAGVLLIGAGGLGSPAAFYLAAAGVGRIGIADADEVAMSNLQRQILHPAKNLGRNKAESAKEGLERLGGGTEIETYPYFVTPENITELVEQYDFVIDAADNFETKFLINDACVLASRPFCHAGVLRFEGQVMTYVPGEGPCYRCIFEEIPKEEDVEKASQVGVIGAAAGIIGCVQALEAIKYIVGAGELLTGKLFVMNGLTMQSRLVPFGKRSEHCRVCGEHADIRDVAANAVAYRRNVRNIRKILCMDIS